MTFAAIQNRLGVQPVGTTVTCVNKSGGTLAIGDLVITSFIHAGAVVNPEQAANTSYVFNCVRKAVSTETGNTGYLGVVTGLMSGAGGNGREVEVQFGGICQAKVLVNDTVGSGTLLGVSSTAGVLSNTVGTSEYSVTLMDNAAFADGTALKRVYIPTEYSFNTTTVIPGVYGSTRASTFIKQGLLKQTNVDFVCIGDSNNLYDAGSGGYMSALVRLTRNANAQYATALYTIKNVFGWTEPNLENKTSVAENGTLATDLANLQSAGTSGTWKPYGDSTVQSPWYNETGTIRNSITGTDGITLYEGHPFFTNAFKYRVVRAQFASGGGSYFQGMADRNNGTIYSPATLIRPSCAGATNVDVIDELSCVTVPYATFSTPSGNPKRQNLSWIGTSIFPSGTFGATNVSNTGKFAGYYHYGYQNLGGMAVNSLFSLGGASLQSLGLGLQTCPSVTIQTYLKHIRLRQIAARGTAGKVVVFIQSGMNDRVNSNTSVGPSPAASNTGAGFVDNCNALRILVTAAWSALGYPSEDLCFLVMVSHPVVSTGDTGDTVMSAMATAVIGAYSNSVDTTVFDIRTVTSGPFLQSSGYYDSLGDAHLSLAGYNFISGLLLNALAA